MFPEGIASSTPDSYLSLSEEKPDAHSVFLGHGIRLAEWLIGESRHKKVPRGITGATNLIISDVIADRRWCVEADIFRC
ncbi:hypothetical protein TNCV_5062841 [Trichonephila clavipes]|nr:hypothetical protein TNCV_5062841 [Trichonephila clavipes]